MESNSTPMDAQSGAAAPASMSERRAWHGNDLRLQSIFDASPAIVFVVDKDNRFVFVNHAWERVFGKTLQQVAGQPVAEIFSEANARAMAEENRRALDVRTPVESEQVVRVGGSPRTFTTSRMALVDENGSPVGVCGVAVDITERKRGENRLRFLAKVASALVVRGDDVDGLMGELCRMLEGELGGDVYFHYRPEGINPRLHLSSYGGIHVSVGQTLEWLDFGAAVCGTVAVTQQPWVIDDVRNSEDPRTQLIRDLGIAAYMCFPLQSNGILLGTVSLGRRNGKFGEEEVEMMRIVADLVSVALDRSKRAHELTEVDANRKKFLAVLAHELRGPLAPITTAANMLVQRAANSRLVQDLGALIQRQTRSLGGLIEELLDEARVSHGKITLEARKVAVADIIGDAVEMIRSSLDARGHALALSLPDEPLYVKGDRRRLVQVIANLLANSAKYTPDGGHIAVEVLGETSAVILSVRDDGIGIDAELMPRIFGFFEQARMPPSAANGGGLGIGLALVKAFVELHGGTIEAHSAGVGRGSEFVVHLPRLKEDA
jgi:PAS domain S-box-containing protein